MRYKTDKVAKRARGLLPLAKEVMEYFSKQALKLQIDLVITETVTTAAEDQWLSRVSSSHREGRAFDVRTSNIPQEKLEKLITAVNKKYAKNGAISKDGERRLIVDKSKTNSPHLHVQIAKE